MSRKIGIVLAVLVFLAGLGVFAYPHIEGAVLESHAAEAVESFRNAFPRETHSSTPIDPIPLENTPILPDRYSELYKAMWEYNRTIYAERQKGLSDPWAYENTSFDLTAYGLETDVFGVLAIPALELEMPLYLGASYDHMAAGAAHLSHGGHFRRPEHRRACPSVGIIPTASSPVIGGGLAHRIFCIWTGWPRVIRSF